MLNNTPEPAESVLSLTKEVVFALKELGLKNEARKLEKSQNSIEVFNVLNEISLELNKLKNE